MRRLSDRRENADRVSISECQTFWDHSDTFGTTPTLSQLGFTIEEAEEEFEGEESEDDEDGGEEEEDEEEEEEDDK